jgi:hypothetical protein
MVLVLNLFNSRFTNEVVLFVNILLVCDTIPSIVIINKMEEDKTNEGKKVFFKFPVKGDQADDCYKDAIEIANNYLREEAAAGQSSAISSDKFNDVFNIYSEVIKTKLAGLKETEKVVLDKEERRRQKLICQFCEKVFSTFANKQKHVLRIHEQMTFKCPVQGCHNAYRDKQNLDIHLTKFHIGGEIFACRFCDAKFNYKRRLIPHEREKHLYHFPYHCIVKCI